MIRSAWESSFRRRDLRPIYEWSRYNTDLQPPLTITGPFDVDRSRHFIKPLEALQSDRVREVNILKPVRGGGTLMADIYIAWARENNPGPTLFLLQTDPVADEHFQNILMPTLQSVPSIKQMLANLGRYDVSKRVIEFADGNNLWVYGPSVNNLQTKGVMHLVMDECWLYQAIMTEAEGRIGDYQREDRSKIVRISQGGPAPGVEIDKCGWNRACESGQRHEWETACLHCGQRYEPVFSGQRADNSFWGITWDHHKLANGDWNIPRCLETVRFECPHCGKPVLDCPKTKAEWNRCGDYKAYGEDNPKRKTFHWECIIADPWEEIVKLWLEADNAARRGGLKPKLAFYQKRRAMNRDEASLLRLGLNLHREVYEINSEWPEERMRFATFDKQSEGRYWGMIRAWSENETRGLWFGEVFGEDGIKELVTRFKVPNNRVAVDSAFEAKGDRGVYAMCVRNGWLAMKGDKQLGYTHVLKHNRRVNRSYAPLEKADPEAGKSGEGRKYCPFLRFSKHALNGAVQTLIDSGRWVERHNENDEMAAELAAQMAARVKVVDYDKRTGFARTYWKETKNDHARDCANMQCTFAIIAELLPDPAAEYKTDSEKKQEQQAA
jgi:hypothetical protein